MINGAAPAALALDEHWARNGKLATLSDEMPANSFYTRYRRANNPLDLRDDASMAIIWR